MRTHKGDGDEEIVTYLVPEDLPMCALYCAIINELDLDGCWHVRLHLNVKDIIKELGLQDGPQVGLYIEDQTQWMLLNPHGMREECEI
jgi:hypothetical protein